MRGPARDAPLREQAHHGSLTLILTLTLTLALALTLTENRPIMAPWVMLDCGDRSSDERVRRTKPSSKPNGPNANHLETLCIATRLPCDALYCPSLNVMVFDHRPSEGAEGNPERDDPCIGKLSIALASYCESTPKSPPNLP